MASLDNGYGSTRRTKLREEPQLKGERYRAGRGAGRAEAERRTVAWRDVDRLDSLNGPPLRDHRDGLTRDKPWIDCEARTGGSEYRLQEPGGNVLSVVQ